LTQPPTGPVRIYNGGLLAMVLLQKCPYRDSNDLEEDSRMANPFDDENRSYLVLLNACGQHSLWPSSLRVPEGWRAIHGPTERHAATHFVDVHWTDIRPTDLSAVHN
jgi:MbtH protein